MRYVERVEYFEAHQWYHLNGHYLVHKVPDSHTLCCCGERREDHTWLIQNFREILDYCCGDTKAEHGWCEDQILCGGEWIVEDGYGHITILPDDIFKKRFREAD